MDQNKKEFEGFEFCRDAMVRLMNQFNDNDIGFNPKPYGLLEHVS